MIDAKQFLDALNELESAKGISKESILTALKEAMTKGLKKQLGGDDALVEVNIDAEKGTIDMAQLKTVVDEVEDDFLEISLADAQKENKNYKVGDYYRIPCKPEEIVKSTALSIKSVLKQKISEAEKEALYTVYKDKIGEMITGVVEKVEENGLSVNISRATIFVPKKELIGDEKFRAKDIIKLYVSDVASGPKGARIVVSRANEGYLKRVFEEEIHEVYDGTIIIKGIAREAGERSKVAVYSNDPNVDPAGACIGPNGTRIQKVVAQLGNSSNKEKVDVIGYSENAGLFIIEALKPAQVVGVNVDKEHKTALAVVNNETLSLALGRKWVNVRLASRLTGYNITIKELDQALQDGDTYQTYEELERMDVEERQKAAMAAYEAQQKAEQAKELAQSGYVAPDQRHYDEELSEEEIETLEEEADRLDEVLEQPQVHQEVIEEKVEVTPEPVKQEKVVEPLVPTMEVKTTTTLQDLEKELADEAKKSKANQTKFKKKKKDSEEHETGIVTSVDPSQRMSIYTEEELRQFEEEDEFDGDEYDDEDVDYDEYDDYYDDDDK